MINADWLQAFVCFAESLNFTRAAKSLHISQPALHVQIRKLAESLGVPLYARQGRKLELTVAGRQLLAFGREQLERTEQLRANLKAETRDDNVVLAAGEGTFLHLLPNALRAFQRVKRAKLCVLTRDREQALTAVQLGEAHLAVTVIDEVPENMLVRPVARARIAVVLPRSHTLARKRSVSLQSLANEPLVVPPQGRPLRTTVARAFADAELSWSPAVEANGWEVMLCFAELGLGFPLVNDFCKPPKGMVLRPVLGLPSVQYHLLRLRDRYQSEAVRALEEAIVSAARVASTVRR